MVAGADGGVGQKQAAAEFAGVFDAFGGGEVGLSVLAEEGAGGEDLRMGVGRRRCD